MLQLIDKKKKILIYIILLIILSTTSNISLENQKNTSVLINTINVSGLSHNTNLEIAQKLKHLLFKNIFFINKDKINKVILEYNVIEKYDVKKIYPKRINIEIKATKYIAEIKSDNKFLVGSNGKLINSELNNEVLPMFFGVGKHAREDLPVLMDELTALYPHVQFTCEQAVGQHPALLQAIVNIAINEHN